MILKKDINKTVANLMELADTYVDASIRNLDPNQHCINRETEVLNIPIGIKMLNEFANDITNRVKHLKHKPKYLLIVDYGCGVGNVLSQLKMLITSKLDFINQSALLGCDKNIKYVNHAHHIMYKSGLCTRSIITLSDLTQKIAFDNIVEYESSIMGTWDAKDVLKIKFCNKMFSHIDDQERLEKNIIDNSLPGTYIIRPMRSAYSPSNVIVKTNQIVMRK